MKYYKYSDGEIIKTNADSLPQLLQYYQLLLQNYLEVSDDLDDPSYVARGNGFCDAKYSEDFINGQIAKCRQRIFDIESWMKE